MIDLPPMLSRYALTLADLRTPTGSLTESRRVARTRLLRDLVAAGHTGTDIAGAFGIHEVSLRRRCAVAGIELGSGQRAAPHPAETHVPGLVACGEFEDAPREDCVHESACLGRLVAEQPSAQGARCRPGCAQRQTPDRDERLRLAMMGGDGYSHPQHG